MKRICLNGLWNARLDPENEGLAQGWAQTPLAAECRVHVPGCIQQLDDLAEKYPPKNGLRNSYLGAWFLETTVTLPPLNGQHATLRLEGANPACHLFWNGQYVSRHDHALCPWETDVTALAREGENRVTIAVTEDFNQMYAGSRFCGLNWSGLFGSAYVELGAAVRLTNLCLTAKGVSGDAEQRGDTPFCGEIQANVCGVCGSVSIALYPGQCKAFSVPLDTGTLPRWRGDAPALVDVQLCCACDTTVFRTGLRTVEAKSGRVLLDGMPVFLAGAGEEFESLQISPLTDPVLIRRRFQALKDHGFTFYRYHTHVPTEEELSIADEMGVFVDAELGLVSNFHKTLPVEKGFDMLAEYVRATRRHPALLAYCLGNEGSQLMVESAVERSKARIGYETIHANTDNQLALTCFGNQGELPELQNDIETPHLWSDNFLAAYDGLSRVPWDLLAQTTLGRPCVVHEYGKFGVWPDMREEETVNALGCTKRDFAAQARLALQEKDCPEREQLFIENSRKQARMNTRVILEEARRQPYISGYALWSFFRGFQRSTGLCSDTGEIYDGDPVIFARGCNSRIALLIDRGFQGRAIPCFVPQSVKITLSNFSRAEAKGTLRVTLWDGEKLLAEDSAFVHATPGETRIVHTFTFVVPVEAHNRRLVLQAEMPGAKNAWDFWAFDPRPAQDLPLLHVQDAALLAALREIFPNACTLQDADSIRIGCRSWNHPQLAETARTLNRPVLADTLDETVLAIRNDVPVLLLDSGRLPKAWYNPALLPVLGERDTGRYFTSFRAGWHTGNLLTVICNHPALGDFPHDGFCDLHCYEMVQSARALNRDALSAALKQVPEEIVYAVAKVPYQEKKQPVVQDPNALREQASEKERSFDWLEQGYLLKAGKTLLCSLNLTRDPAGRALLKNLVRYFVEGNDEAR